MPPQSGKIRTLFIPLTSTRTRMKMRARIKSVALEDYTAKVKPFFPPPALVSLPGGVLRSFFKPVAHILICLYVRGLICLCELPYFSRCGLF